MELPYFKLLAILILVLANGFFAASEFALIASRRGRINHLVRRGDKRAMRIQKLHQQPDRFLATIQIGIAFLSTLAGVFGGAAFVSSLSPVIKQVPVHFIQDQAEPIAIVLIGLGISFFTVLIGELIPKYIALAKPESIALLVSLPISLFSRMTSYLAGFMAALARTIVRLFGITRIPHGAAVTKEDIRILVSEGAEEGVIDPGRHQMIRSVIDISEITVRQAMTPRIDIVGIQADWDEDRIVETMAKNGYSRYPVYQGSLDEITGVVYTKDLISVLTLKGVVILPDIIRKPLHVPDSMPLPFLLAKFQKSRVHIAIVLDEFGGTAGLITLEDIIEEIVGEIQDEHDQEQPDLVVHSERVVYASGTVRPEIINSTLGVELPVDLSDTLAGLVIELLGRMPEAADEVSAGGAKLRVLETDDIRVKRVRVEKLPRTV
jgi:putative hemolysin